MATPPVNVIVKEAGGRSAVPMKRLSSVVDGTTDVKSGCKGEKPLASSYPLAPDPVSTAGEPGTEL